MLSLNWNILWTFVDLIILYLLLRRFLFKPVVNIMEERKNLIEERVGNAKYNEELTSSILEDMQRNTEEKERIAEEQLNQQLQIRKERAAQENRQIIAQAKEQAEAIIESSKKEALRERDKMLVSTKNELSEVAVAAARKIAGTNPNIDMNAELFQNLLKKAGGD